MSREGDLILYSTQEWTHCDAMHWFVDDCLDALRLHCGCCQLFRGRTPLFRGEGGVGVDILVGSYQGPRPPHCHAVIVSELIDMTTLQPFANIMMTYLKLAKRMQRFPLRITVGIAASYGNFPVHRKSGTLPIGGVVQSFSTSSWNEKYNKYEGDELTMHYRMTCSLIGLQSYVLIIWTLAFFPFVPAHCKLIFSLISISTHCCHAVDLPAHSERSQETCTPMWQGTTQGGSVRTVNLQCPSSRESTGTKALLSWICLNAWLIDILFGWGLCRFWHMVLTMAQKYQ